MSDDQLYCNIAIALSGAAWVCRVGAGVLSIIQLVIIHPIIITIHHAVASSCAHADWLTGKNANTSKVYIHTCSYEILTIPVVSQLTSAPAGSTVAGLI